MSTKQTVSSDIDTDSQNPHSACDVSSVGVEELKNLLNQLEILSGDPQSVTFPERQDKIWKLCTHIALSEKTFYNDIRILFLNLARDILPIKDMRNGLEVIDTYLKIRTMIKNYYPDFEKNIDFIDMNSNFSGIWSILINRPIQPMKMPTNTSTKIKDICLYLAVYWDGDPKFRPYCLLLTRLVTNNKDASEITKIWNIVSNYVKNYPHPLTNESYDKFVIKHWCLQLYSAMYTYQSNPNPQMRNQNTRNDQKSTTIRHTTNTPHAIHHTTSQHPPQNSGHGLPVRSGQHTPAHVQHPRHHSGQPMFSRYIPWHANPNRLPPAVYRRPDGSHFILSNKITPQETTSDPTDSTTQSDQSENSATVETV
jgi:hypothetical protein